MLKKDIKVVCKKEIESSQKYKKGKVYFGQIEEHSGRDCFPNGHCTLVWIDQGEDNPGFGGRFAVKGNVRGNHGKYDEEPTPYWHHYTRYFIDYNIWERKEKLKKLNASTFFGT